MGCAHVPLCVNVTDRFVCLLRTTVTRCLMTGIRSEKCVVR